MHHESHVAGALYTRPWQSKDDTVMVSIDGVGEEQSVVIYDSNFNVKFEPPQSIGWLYGATTNYLDIKDFVMNTLSWVCLHTENLTMM